MIAILAAAVVHFTSPCSQADTSVCSGSAPAHSIQRLALVGWQRYAPSPETLATKAAAFPCQPETLAFDDRGLVWSLSVVAGNDAGWSCQSNAITINAPLAVPVDPDGISLWVACRPGASRAWIAWTGGGPATLAVFDLEGRLAGSHSSEGAGAWAWDCTRAPQGLYFVRLIARGRIRTARFAVLR